MASATSPIMSPAWVPTMPPPRIFRSRCDTAVGFGAVIEQQLRDTFVAAVGNGVA